MILYLFCSFFPSALSLNRSYVFGLAPKYASFATVQYLIVYVQLVNWNFHQYA